MIFKLSHNKNIICVIFNITLQHSIWRPTLRFIDHNACHVNDHLKSYPVTAKYICSLHKTMDFIHKTGFFRICPNIPGNCRHTYLIIIPVVECCRLFGTNPPLTLIIYEWLGPGWVGNKKCLAYLSHQNFWGLVS